ncbi:alpha/beta hydrolase family protein [Qipengyuania sp. DGS5-3]|uniref:alpha/beta hydrolase family protein n=1 Tax=Qipengyuania sp. DGS5-3 TaxID=3349632 RepID=UPI0036D36C11
MKKRYIALGVLGIACVGVGVTAFVASPTIHEGAPGEMPELGRPGVHTIGTQEIAFTMPQRISFPKLGLATGQTDRVNRTLQVRFWYPAEAMAGAQPITYTHTMDPPDMEPFRLEFSGRALADAPPSDSSTYPLVMISHGFNGWGTQMSNLGEHLASRGYVVASIDHADMKLEGAADFIHSFAKVLVDRSLDQRQILAQIAERSGDNARGVFAIINAEQTGLIGYSMGGYGALANAGGAYDFDSSTLSSVPDQALEVLKAATAGAAPIDAVVAMAPWGGQPDNRVWSAETLSQIEIPSLIISGSADDVSNHSEGVSWIFDSLTGTQRHMLVFREARHNIAGNAFDLPEGAPFRAIEFLNEPVWRQGRINGINQHFVTAFLDLHLKGEEDKRSYLDVPVPNANDGTWEVGFGDQLNGKLAGPDEGEHWRGFQRRWALGLDLVGKEAGE